MSARRWIRVDIGWSDSDWLIGLTPAGRLAWIELLCYAKAYGHAGRVKAMSPAAAGKKWDIPPSDVEAMLEAAQADGALELVDGDWVIGNWSRYQEGDRTATLRQRARRERLRTGKHWAEGKSCEVCGSTEDLTRDHIVPVNCDGTNDPANLRILCRRCNRARKNDPTWDERTGVSRMSRVTPVTPVETETKTETETETETSSQPPPPPPPSRARARVEEGHQHGPDAAGPRLAADGEVDSHDQPEPDRQALIREMQAAVEARARKIRGERRQARFVARAKAIIGGDDYTVWRDGHGRAAPWPDRPRLLRLALARTEGEDDPDLRAALRYVVLQQLDPVEPPTAEELRSQRPPPGSEAAKIRDELPQRNGHHTSELVRVGVWMAGDDPAEREQERLDALVREWEQKNPAEAEALRKRIAEEVASDPAWQGIARAALPGLVRSRYRLAVRDLLERQEVAT